MSFWSAYKTRRALTDLTERLETVERRLKAVEIEWENTYDKLRQTMGRLNKRAAREETQSLEEAERPLVAGADSAEVGETVTTHHTFLTPNQRRIQQEILRRRAGM